MTNLLVRLFIKDADKTDSPKVRERYGMLSSWVAIVCNLFLFAAKFILGLISNSIAITGDAFNNLSDVGSGVVTFIGFKAAAAPADEDHPFGHGRIEYISGMVITFFVLLVGFDVVKSSVEKIIHPEPVEFSLFVIAGLLLSILVKLWMSMFNRKLDKKIDSGTLRAAAQDSLNDCISTGATTLGIIIARFLPFPIDGFLGLMVGGFILYSGYGLAKETISPILGQKPDPELVHELYDIILSYPDITGVHDLVLHDYGPGRIMGSAHVEVSRTIDVMQAHDMIDNAEKHVQSVLHMPFVLHYDPIADDCEETQAMRKKIAEIVSGINDKMTIHDFRMVPG
ncbi:MAG: cation diffusion facilitator family transporter, partial [Oscillospiraceae bacterium]